MYGERTKEFMYGAVGSFLQYKILRTHLQSCRKREYTWVNKLGTIHKIQCYTPVTFV